MKKRLQRCESILWLCIRGILYFTLLFIFFGCLALQNHSLRTITRSLGITLSTFCISGILFLKIYGGFDIGRRKSKPIIYSLVLAVLFTDIVTYLQLMIMRTTTPSILAFRLRSLDMLLLAYILQVLVIIAFSYGFNILFFKIHAPERCCIITNSQKSLNSVVHVLEKYKKQYSIDAVYDFRDPDIKNKLNNIDTVFLYNVSYTERRDLIQFCYEHRINIYFNPNTEDVIEKTAEYYILEDMPLFNANVKYFNMQQRIIKRLIDLILGLLLGLLSSPFWITAAIVIKLHDGGSILFKQKRATINGKVFEVYKFRTMKENVENRSAQENDDRITKPGHFLRKTRIDELPQLINIIKGDMTFVGPRPEMLENVSEYTKTLPVFSYRLRVKAGLTGYAQIAGKYNTSPKDKLIMDMMYIHNFSIWHDIQLLFQTAIVLLKKDSTEAFSSKNEIKYKFVKYKKKKDTK